LDEETDMSTVAVDYITQAKTIRDRIESTNEVVTLYGHLDILASCAAGSGCKELGVNLFSSGKVLRNPDKLLKTI
jgi:hypothetical protein